MVLIIIVGSTLRLCLNGTSSRSAVTGVAPVHFRAELAFSWFRYQGSLPNCKVFFTCELRKLVKVIRCELDQLHPTCNMAEGITSLLAKKILRSKKTPFMGLFSRQSVVFVLSCLCSDSV